MDQRSDSTRYLAAHLLLRDYGDTRALDTAIHALQNAEPGVREAIVGVLKEVDHPKVVTAFAEALSDPLWRVRWTAAQVLHEKGDEAVVDALIQALDDDESLVRHEAIRALAEIGSSQAVGALCDVLLYHEEIGTRRSAAAALGDIGDPAAEQPLLRCIQGGDDSIRHESVSALHKLRDSSVAAVADLYLALLNQADPQLEAEARAALMPIGTELPDIGLLFELCSDMLQSTREPVTKIALLVSLMKVGTVEAARVVVGAMQDPDPLVRLIAVTVLGQIGDTTALPRLAHIVEESSADPESKGLVDATKKAIEEIRSRCGK
jgi:HEAT repeat protein